jgi:uncharacterized membrane protein
MSTSPGHGRHHAPYVVRIIRGRPRLFASGAVGLVLAAALPAEWWVTTRLLVAWVAAVVLYLGLVYHVMASASVASIRRRAALEDEGRMGLLVLTVSSALASLGAIIIELGSGQNLGNGRDSLHLILAVVTILASWAFIHTIFALHYAHEFYHEGARVGGGLTFPGNEQPDYWDFVYFSFVVGMTAQVSDVGISSKPIRRTVTAHGVVSFIFNAALLALTVNIAAGAI